MTGQYLDQELKKEPDALPEELMKGTIPSIKREMLTKKLANRFDNISGHIIGSYKHEMKMIGKKPVAPSEYRLQIMNEKGLKNAGELARFLVAH